MPLQKSAPGRPNVNDEDISDENDVFGQQLNVRFKVRRAHQARRLAASRGESMQEFFDRLVLAEVEREQEILKREFEEEERRARIAREELERDIASLATT
ncbi:hypothetical protein [Nocardioides lacusdianchii]|uniref:hypothetical protein n=1 Tax=Nocardioides lacusdianchii TaxID=2783664 RepID=UPI001CCFC714|nr:hypothetical protein [Nocardioides lacusdianchii]